MVKMLPFDSRDSAVGSRFILLYVTRERQTITPETTSSVTEPKVLRCPFPRAIFRQFKFDPDSEELLKWHVNQISQIFIK
jgi:hypothetical protein